MPSNVIAMAIKNVTITEIIKTFDIITKVVHCSYSLPSPPFHQAKFFLPQLKGFLGRYKNGDHHQVDEEAYAIDPLVLDEEDSDVCSERKKVLTGQTTENDVVIIKDLHKVTGQIPYQAGLILSLHSTLDRASHDIHVIQFVMPMHVGVFWTARWLHCAAT